MSPVTLNAISTAFERGDLAGAEAAQARFSALRKDLYAFGFPPALVKRALRHAMPEVGASRAPVLITEEADAQVAVISKANAEAVS